MRKVLLPLAVVLVLLAIWEVLAETGTLADILGIRASASDAIVPAPSDVVASLWDDRSLLAEHGLVTLVEILLGFGIAVICGAGFAIALHLSDTLRRTFYPLLVASQTIPIVAIAPVLAIWLGFGIGPKLFIVALICFFPITVATLDGLRSVDPAAIRMMRTLDASRAVVLRRLEMPWALPRFFSGTRVAAAIAAIGAVLGELVGANEGLGYLITTAQGNYNTARVFASVVVLSAIALALFATVSLLERTLAPWGRKDIR
jgi:ABC-type nitrate/sulfonate/bicarbonate transport system permease component